MKKHVLTFSGFLYTILSFGQVGINTEEPTSMLDINGDVRIRNVPVNNTLTNVLVINNTGEVSQNQTMGVSNVKSFIRGTGSTSMSLINLTILQGWYQIGFSSTTFDENSEYSTTTYLYTAKQDGIYDIYVQAKSESVVSAAEFGVGIFKKGVNETAYTLIAEETYLSININLVGLINIDVSPPIRSTRTLLKLKLGDVITFAVKVPLVSLKLIGGSSSFFSIYQVK